MKLVKILSIAIIAILMFTVVGCEKSTETSQSKTKQEVIVLQLGHTQTTEHLINESALKFAELVNKKTNGEVKVEVFPSETLGTNKELADACSSGDVDFYISATGQYTSRYQPFTVVEAFYMFRDTDHLFKFYESDIYNELVEGLAEKVNVHVLAPLYYGARLMTTKGTPLYSPDDFIGLKFRAANEPLPIAAIETLGGTPTPIAYNETYLALQQGVVDGQENPPASIVAMKFYEVQDYLNLSYHQYQMLSLFMSDAAMKKLNEKQVALVYEAALEVSEEHNKKAVALEQTFIDQIGEYCEIIETDVPAFAEKISVMYEQFEEIWGKDTVEKIQAIK